MRFQNGLIVCIPLLWLGACGSPAASSDDGDAAGGSTGAQPATGTGGAGVGGSSSDGTGTGGVGTGGVGTGGTTTVTPVDCSPIAAHDGWDLCESGPDFCTAVFNDGAGCQAVCAAVGLDCTGTWEDIEGVCGANTSLPALSCSSPSGHDSDYCRCGTGSSNPTGSGGTTSTGGTGGAGTGGTGSTGTTCTNITNWGTVNSTIVVESGETFDGNCQRYIAGSSLGDGSQEEGQEPVFVLEDGAVLRNVVLGAPAADGIHTEGDAQLFNVHWEDVGEDALTVEGSGTVVIDGGSAYDAADKIFQLNAVSTFEVKNFVASNAGKLIRQNGGTTFTAHVVIDGCDISNMSESIFRTDSSSSTVTMTNTRYSDIGDTLFLGVNPSNITVSGNTEY